MTALNYREMRRLWCAAGICAAAACAPVRDLMLPPAAGAVALVSIGEPLTPSTVDGFLVATDDDKLLAPPNVPFTYALAYDHALSVLRWREGPITYDPLGTSRLRKPDRVLELGDDGGWTDITASAIDWPAIGGGFLMAWADDRCGEPPTCIDAGGRCVLCDAPVPLAPARPTPWPTVACPAGMEVTRTMLGGERIESCVPAAQQACTGPTRATLGGGCLPIGRECTAAADGFPEPPPSGPGALIWATPTGNGDGSRANPTSLIVALATPRTTDATIILSRGTHATATLGQSLRMTKIAGVCAGQTTVQVTLPAVLAYASFAFDDLTLTPGQIGMPPGSTFELRGVYLQGVAGVVALIYMREATFHGSDLTIDDARLAVFGGSATGVDLELRRGAVTTTAAGSLDLARIVAHDTIRGDGRSRIRVSDSAIYPIASLTGVVAVTGSTLTLDHVAVMGGKTGTQVRDSGRLEVVSSHFEGQWFTSMSAHGEGEARVELSVIDTVVRSSSAAIRLENAADTDVRGLAVKDSGSVGIGGDAEARRAKAQVTLRDFRLQGAPSGGVALKGYALTIERAVIEDTLDYGVHMRTDHDDSRTSLAVIIRDIVVRRALHAAIEVDGSDLRGVTETAEIERALVEDIQGVGISVRDGFRTTELRDLTVRRARGVGRHGDGVGLQFRCEGLGGLNTLERFVVEDAGRVGIVVGRDTLLEASNGAVTAPIGFIGFPDEGIDWRDILQEVTLDSLLFQSSEVTR